jgi:outer membrane murein-binding lipoprotein Lpp
MLVAAGVLQAIPAVLAARDGSALRPLHVVAGVAALLLLHGIYNGLLSPTARTQRDSDVRAFAAQVRQLTTPRDQLRIASGVRGSVFFFLDHNEAALSSEELWA